MAEEGLPFKAIAEVMGRQLHVPVIRKSPDEANDHFGLFATFVGMDAPATSERTRTLLSWEPKQPDLIADLDRPGYFAS